MDKIATMVADRWDQLEQDIASTKSPYRARLLPVLQAMRQHPRIGRQNNSMGCPPCSREMVGDSLALKYGS